MSRSHTVSAPLPASASGTIGPQNANLTLAYRGYTVRETAGASAIIRIRDLGAATGRILATVSLSANESTSDELVNGLRADVGLYVELVSGTMPEGVVLYA